MKMEDKHFFVEDDIMARKQIEDSESINKANNQQGERVRSRKVDSTSNEVTRDTSQLKSNKRSMGNPADTQIVQEAKGEE